MTDLTTPVTADWLWQMAGPDMWLYKWTADGQHMLQGKGARCRMTGAEYAKYLAMKDKWRAAGQDMQGAPTISMLVVSSEEELEMAALRLRPNSDFAGSFREIEECLLAYARCLSDDERDEIIRQLAGKVLPLKEAVLRAEEIWREMEGGAA